MSFTKENASEKEAKVEKPRNFNPGKEESKKRRKLEKLESQMAAVEEELERLKEELNLPQNASDYTLLQEIQSKIDTNEEKLLSLMEEWEEYVS